MILTSRKLKKLNYHSILRCKTIKLGLILHDEQRKRNPIKNRQSESEL